MYSFNRKNISCDFSHVTTLKFLKNLQARITTSKKNVTKIFICNFVRYVKV